MIYDLVPRKEFMKKLKKFPPTPQKRKGSCTSINCAYRTYNHAEIQSVFKPNSTTIFICNINVNYLFEFAPLSLCYTLACEHAVLGT
mmetsp:Transcript_19895/g.34851  ORF Transcript_19895/g.34851 Transcript_19895/m.34851 type:complete len:87 (-) Transcript_19895:54-314(-)